MTDQLKEIGIRLKALREIMDLTEEQMAKECQVDLQDYIAHEQGEKDFSFSFLYNAASVLGVDVIDIMSGDSPKLSTCSLVRKDQGLQVKRYDAYSYEALAYTFRNKNAEPFLVTVEPLPSPEAEFELHDHEGQEFQYLLEGEAKIIIGDTTLHMHAGDALYFDSSVPHALLALNGKSAKFIAVVVK